MPSRGSIESPTSTTSSSSTFPDPTNYSLGKLYTTAFYRRSRATSARRGRFVVQSTSPLFARKSFWCIVETLKQAGLQTYPYHVYVPSFGEWGFVMASTHEYPRRLSSCWTTLRLGRGPACDVSVPARHVTDADAAQSTE